MIIINYDRNGKSVKCTIKGNQFYEILDYFKLEKGFRFDADNKTWDCSPFYFIDNGIYESLLEIDEVQISQGDHKKVIEDSKPVLEVKKLRKKYYDDAVNFTPVKGKEPNEDYQIIDIKRFLNTNRGGIFWEQGLGKAVFLSVHLSQLYKNSCIDKAVVLTPSSGLYNLRREILTFSNLFNEEEIVIANKDNREPFKEEAKIVIMTYRTFLLISDHYYKKNNENGRAKKYRKKQIPFDEWIKKDAVIYLDESHNIANPTARQSHVLHLHKDYFEYRYIMSGTPADKVTKYYSQIKFLDENIIPYTYSEWLPKVCNIGNRFSMYAINYEYPDKVKSFMKKIEPYVIQRKTESHLDLPKNRVLPVLVELSDKQRNIMNEVVKAVMLKIKNEEGSVTVRSMVNKFPYISLALDNPDIINLDEYVESGNLKTMIKKWKFNNESDNRKIEMLDDIISQTVEQGHKLIIWDGHPKTIDELTKKYAKYNPLSIHGQSNFKELGMTRDEYRDMVVTKFKGKEHNLLIASFKVLATAVTMTECNHQVYFTRSYDLTDWLQSQKRIHRISQKKEVKTWVLIYEKTLEENLNRNLIKKENVNSKLLDKDFLEKGDWEALFNGEELF